MEHLFNKNKVLKSFRRFFRILMAIIIAISYTGLGTVWAQTDSVSNAEPNEAMKSVFQQLKKEVKTNDTLSSILMILGVILIVIVAVFLSFKSGSDEKRPRLKNASPKKA